jgi:NAD(P)-dependent dehydrogenase (short-subunit alcohol dehydrogenase family)
MAGSYARFTGKTGLVTGAGMGIGAAIARALAGEGAAVAVVDRDAAAAEQVSAEITAAGGRAIAVAGSVTDAADAERAVQAAADAFGGLDLLVNNAGVVIYGVLPEYREQDWDTVVDTNLKGQFLMAKYALPYLRARGGGVRWPRTRRPRAAWSP